MSIPSCKEGSGLPALFIQFLCSSRIVVLTLLKSPVTVSNHRSQCLQKQTQDPWLSKEIKKSSKGQNFRSYLACLLLLVAQDLKVLSFMERMLFFRYFILVLIDHQCANFILCSSQFSTCCLSVRADQPFTWSFQTDLPLHYFNLCCTEAALKYLLCGGSGFQVNIVSQGTQNLRQYNR